MSNFHYTSTKAIELLIDQLRHISPILHDEKFDKFRKNCCNCANFNNQLESCITYKVRPPAKIIAYGCDSFIHIDEIPF
jgi:hypothetical protein